MLKKNLPWATRENKSDQIQDEIKSDNLSPFGFLKSLQGKQTSPDFSREEVHKAYLPFMMNRIISMNPTFLAVVNEMNMFSDIPKEHHYKYYESLISKRYFFYEYIKKDSDKEEKTKENLNKYFEFGTRDLGIAMKILTEDQKEIISKKYVSCMG